MKFISYQERRNKENRLIRRYKVYNFLFFKIKKKVLPVFGENNKIIIGGQKLTENDKQLLDKAGRITIEGNNNIVELSDVNDLKCDIHIIGNNNKVSIGKFKLKYVSTISIIMSSFNNKLIIEDSMYIGLCQFVLKGKNSVIHIGKNSLFSENINIWNTDHHPIYDLETNKRINDEQNIMIGDHVWLGKDVVILKNSIIPSGCVVGMRSLVNKAFPKENCIIAGTPAKVVKENIRWELS